MLTQLAPRRQREIFIVGGVVQRGLNRDDMRVSRSCAPLCAFHDEYTVGLKGYNSCVKRRSSTQENTL